MENSNFTGKHGDDVAAFGALKTRAIAMLKTQIVEHEMYLEAWRAVRDVVEGDAPIQPPLRMPKAYIEDAQAYLQQIEDLTIGTKEQIRSIMQEAMMQRHFPRLGQGDDDERDDISFHDHMRFESEVARKLAKLAHKDESFVPLKQRLDAAEFEKAEARRLYDEAQYNRPTRQAELSYHRNDMAGDVQALLAEVTPLLQDADQRIQRLVAHLPNKEADLQRMIAEIDPEQAEKMTRGLVNFSKHQLDLEETAHGVQIADFASFSVAKIMFEGYMKVGATNTAVLAETLQESLDHRADEKAMFEEGPGIIEALKKISGIYTHALRRYQSLSDDLPDF